MHACNSSKTSVKFENRIIQILYTTCFPQQYVKKGEIGEFVYVEIDFNLDYSLEFDVY